jgi:hypothetical protein
MSVFCGEIFSVLPHKLFVGFQSYVYISAARFMHALEGIGRGIHGPAKY